MKKNKSNFLLRFSGRNNDISPLHCKLLPKLRHHNFYVVNSLLPTGHTHFPPDADKGEGERVETALACVKVGFLVTTGVVLGNNSIYI